MAAAFASTILSQTVLMLPLPASTWVIVAVGVATPTRAVILTTGTMDTVIPTGIRTVVNGANANLTVVMKGIAMGMVETIGTGATAGARLLVLGTLRIIEGAGAILGALRAAAAPLALATMTFRPQVRCLPPTELMLLVGRRSAWWRPVCSPANQEGVVNWQIRGEGRRVKPLVAVSEHKTESISSISTSGLRCPFSIAQKTKLSKLSSLLSFRLEFSVISFHLSLYDYVE